MKINFRTGGLATILAAGLLFAGTSIADEGGQATEGYVGDSSGHIVRDSAGDCVRTSSWKAEDMTVDCGAEPPAAVVTEAAPPPPPPVVLYEKNTMSATALFDFDSANLKEAGKVSLHELGDSIKAKGAKVVDIDIIGHTDSTGPAEYNQALSADRAYSVTDILTNQGVNESRIVSYGRGETEPVASNDDEYGKSQNRRVEIIIRPKA